jgi:hypothetical protein
VVATFTDALGGTTAFESSAQTVANVDDAATGTLVVTGMAEEGGTLTATLSGVSDDDGTTTTAYRWQELVNTTWTDLNDATAATLSIPDDQSFVGKQVRVVATTTDTLGGTTTFEGSAQSVANVDDEATGALSVTGNSIIGSLLNANITDLLDADGPVSNITWQWQRGTTVEEGGAMAWVDIPYATDTNFSIPIGSDQLGAALRVVVTTADPSGGSTVLISTPTAKIEGVQANIAARFWADAEPIADVHIETNNGAMQAQTGQDGHATLHDLSGTSIALSAQKTLTAQDAPAVSQAVTLQDAVAILKMISGRPVTAPDAVADRARSLAADLDGSGSVSLADAIAVLRHTVGLPAPAPSWVFFGEDDATSSAHSKLQPGVPEPITVSMSPPTTVEVGLVGLLRGDVDGSWDPNRFGVGGA